MNIAVVWLRARSSASSSSVAGCARTSASTGSSCWWPGSPDPFAAADKIVAFELELDAHGYMPLVRAIEDLTPDYRVRVLDDPMLDLDFVHLRFATKPGDRHVVEINGQDFGGFRKSDLKFLRMLLLAAARKHGKDDGWLDKSRLRDGSDKDPALNDLRADLGKYDLYGLGEEERKALPRATRHGPHPPRRAAREHRARRLARRPHLRGPTTTTKKDGTKTKPTKKQEEGLQNAATLLRDCRRLGAPGEVEDAKTPAATSRRGRSAP